MSRPGPLDGDGLHRHPRQTVALVEPAGQIPLGLQAQIAKTQDHESRGRDAVGVVVAVDDDAVTPVDGRRDRRDRALHVGEQERVGDVGGAVEEPARLDRVDEAPPRQDHGRHERQAESRRPARCDAAQE